MARNLQDRVDELLHRACTDDQLELVLADAARGLDEPESLTLLKMERVCFVLVAATDFIPHNMRLMPERYSGQPG